MPAIPWLLLRLSHARQPASCPLKKFAGALHLPWKQAHRCWKVVAGTILSFTIYKLKAKRKTENDPNVNMIKQKHMRSELFYVLVSSWNFIHFSYLLGRFHWLWCARCLHFGNNYRFHEPHGRRQACWGLCWWRDDAVRLAYGSWLQQWSRYFWDDGAFLVLYRECLCDVRVWHWLRIDSESCRLHYQLLLVQLQIVIIHYQILSTNLRKKRKKTCTFWLFC